MTPPPAVGRLADRLRPWARRSHLVSTLLALAGYLASMSPSLLPRTWAIQGAIAGVCATFGYAVGRLLEGVGGAAARWARLEVTMRPAARRLLLWGWPVLLVLIVLITPVATLRRHQRTAEIVGTRAPTALELVLATGVAALVFALLLGLWAALSALVGWTARQLDRALPRWAARTIAAVVVVALLGVATDRLVVDTFISRAVSAADTVNRGGLDDDPPTSRLRSGSAGSAESWSSLGHAGRTFVGSGPSQDEIAAATGAPALEPIRVYAGLARNRDLDDTARSVVAELERTGAFEREAILVIATTGTGWVNEWVPSSFELLLGGDSAIAAMQYSTLPSALAFIESATTPPEAGTALITAVEEALAALPERTRPRLYLSGESLGAYAANAAFDSLDDMLARVDGAVFTGTPGFTPSTRRSPTPGSRARPRSCPSSTTADTCASPRTWPSSRPTSSAGGSGRGRSRASPISRTGPTRSCGGIRASSSRPRTGSRSRARAPRGADVVGALRHVLAGLRGPRLGEQRAAR